MASKRIKRHKKTGALSGPKYWITVGALAAYSATGSGKLASAQTKANDPTTRSGARVEASAAEVMRWQPGP